MKNTTIMMNLTSDLTVKFYEASEAQKNLKIAASVELKCGGITIISRSIKIKESKYEDSKQKYYVAVDALQDGKFTNILERVKKDCGICDISASSVNEAISLIQAVYNNKANKISRFCKISTSNNPSLYPIAITDDMKKEILSAYNNNIGSKEEIVLKKDAPINISFYDSSDAQKAINIAGTLGIEVNGIRVLPRNIKIRNSVKENQEGKYYIAVEGIQNGKITDALAAIKNNCKINNMQVSTVREAISALEEVYNTKNNNTPKYLFVTSTYEGKTTITAPVRLTKESKEEILNMYEAAEEMEEGKENKETEPEDNALAVAIAEIERLKAELAAKPEKKAKPAAKKAPKKAKTA